MKPPKYKSDRFILRPYSKNDEQRFVEMNLDSVTQEFMGGTDNSEDSERKLFESIFALYEKKSKDRWFWIWGIYENEKLVGHFELKETEHTADDELEIVYIIHPDERRRGIMREILDLIKDKQTELNKKIIATVNFKNINSMALLERWGITKRQTIRETDSDYEYLKVWLKS